MLAISTTLAAAAYLLIGQPAHHAGQAVALRAPPPCQLTMNMDPAPPAHGNHITVRWVGSHHHHHRHHA